MSYEFIEFYPFQEGEVKNKKAIGTCHVYCIDSELDIRGILVLECNNHYLFKLPSRSQIDPETKEKVHYPCVFFANDERKKKFFETLFKEGIPVIKEKMEQHQKANADRKRSKGPRNAQNK